MFLGGGFPTCLNSDVGFFEHSILSCGNIDGKKKKHTLLKALQPGLSKWRLPPELYLADPRHQTVQATQPQTTPHQHSKPILCLNFKKKIKKKCFG
jgi:hypothetical protein